VLRRLCVFGRSNSKFKLPKIIKKKKKKLVRVRERERERERENSGRVEESKWSPKAQKGEKSGGA